MRTCDECEGKAIFKFVGFYSDNEYWLCTQCRDKRVIDPKAVDTELSSGKPASSNRNQER